MTRTQNEAAVQVRARRLLGSGEGGTQLSVFRIQWRHHDLYA
jgi:hypothetical protein